jgi:ribosomal protein L12E/L44/L45/RPP1/RPP2
MLPLCGASIDLFENVITSSSDLTLPICEVFDGAESEDDMLIEHLPVTGNNPPVQIHNQNRQRVTEFLTLESALNDGEVSSAKTLVDQLLRQNAPNVAQSLQKQREFGYQQSLLQQVGKALEGENLEEAKKAFQALKKGGVAVKAVSEQDQNQQGERGNANDRGQESFTPSSEEPDQQTLGGSLNTLA